MAESKTVLVTGATGKQGRAMIHALLNPEQVSPSATVDGAEYHVVALTRAPSSSAAQALLKAEGSRSNRITLVQGDLNEPQSIRKIFEEAAMSAAPGTGGIFGVFTVLAFPGLGADATSEGRQAKLLADLALEFHVAAYLYSSSIPVGPRSVDAIESSHKGKAAIEAYCEELGERGLNWVFIRPGFFMENFDGFLGRIAATIFEHGMSKDTTICLVASEDIGRVAAGVIRNHQEFLHKALVVTSGPVTMAEVKEAHQRATNRPLPTIPWFIGKLLLWLNQGARNVVEQVERSHRAVAEGRYPTLASEIGLAKSVCHLQTFYEWKMKGTQSGGRGAGGYNWNQVSLLRLLTGRS